MTPEQQQLALQMVQQAQSQGQQIQVLLSQLLAMLNSLASALTPPPAPGGEE